MKHSNLELTGKEHDTPQLLELYVFNRNGNMSFFESLPKIVEAAGKSLISFAALAMVAICVLVYLHVKAVKAPTFKIASFFISVLSIIGIFFIMLDTGKTPIPNVVASQSSPMQSKQETHGEQSPAIGANHGNIIFNKNTGSKDER